MSLEDMIAQMDATTQRLLSDYSSGNSQQAWESAKDVSKEPGRKISGNAFLSGTGRINAGIGTGDIATRDDRGNVTGYRQRQRASLTPGLDNLKAMQVDAAEGKPLAGASGTPGLDALHKANPDMPVPFSAPLVRKTIPTSKPFSVSPQQTAEFASRVFA